VLADPDIGGRQLLDRWMARSSLRLAPVIESNSFEFLRGCLLYDQAITFQIALGAVSDGGQLVARDIEDRGFPRGQLVLAHLRERSMPVIASALADHLRALLSTAPPADSGHDPADI
jgi:DNA-binding transcriptional LysR family regulator